MGGFGNFLKGLAEGGMKAISGDPLGAFMSVAGFVTSQSDRQTAANNWAKQKTSAKETQVDLEAAARGEIKKYGVETGIAADEYMYQQQGGILDYKNKMKQFDSIGQSTGMAGLGSAQAAKQSYLEGFNIQQGTSKLGYEKTSYALASEAEQRIRDIQNNLTQLSAVSGNKYDILSMIPEYSIT